MTEQELVERVERVEYAVLLLAKHIGSTGSDRALQEVLDAIADDDRDLTLCGKIFPLPVPGEVVRFCARARSHDGPHQAETGEVWVFRS